MLDTFLPARIDNTYRGHRLALWLFGAVVLLKLAIALGSIFNGYEAASSADGIPLASYPADAARAVVTLFALLGLLHLVIGGVCAVVLIRYRALIPFAFAVLIAEYLGRRLILFLLPIEHTSAAPGLVINLVVLAAMVAGLALSLRVRSGVQAH
jgi:hypothetical protein